MTTLPLAPRHHHAWWSRPVLRCWANGCTEPLSSESTKWCPTHLASMPAAVARATAWLLDGEEGE